MKQITRKLNTALIAILFVVPAFASADWVDYGTYDYGGSNWGTYDYDDYSWGTYDYGNNYGTYDYGNNWGTYDYDDYSWGTYDYGNNYGNNWGTYDYDDYSWGTYDYDDYTWGTYEYSNYGDNWGTYEYDDWGTYEYDTWGTYEYDDYTWSGYQNPVTYNKDPYYYDDPYYQDNPHYYDDPYYYDEPNYYYNDYTWTGGGCFGGCGGGGDVIVINEPNDLDVECVVSDTYVNEGDRVTFTANVRGGSGSVAYYWDGDIRSESRIVSVIMGDENISAYVTVIDRNGNEASDSCPVVRVEKEQEEDNLNIRCEISDTRIESGDRIRVSVDIDGGNSPYDIRWSGDVDKIDDFDKDRKSQYIRIYEEGNYRFRVTVEDDDGNRETDVCSVIYVDDEKSGATYTSSNKIFDYPSSSVNSVFLNQVPRTGPADTLKGIGIIVLILAWSFAGAYMIRKRIKQKDAAKKIAEFKESNKQIQNI